MVSDLLFFMESSNQEHAWKHHGSGPQAIKKFLQILEAFTASIWKVFDSRVVEMAKIGQCGSVFFSVFFGENIRKKCRENGTKRILDRFRDFFFDFFPKKNGKRKTGVADDQPQHVERCEKVPWG